MFLFIRLKDSLHQQMTTKQTVLIQRICPILYITTALTPTLPVTMSVRYLMYSTSVAVLTSFILVSQVFVVTANSMKFGFIYFVNL
ncbi:hypothetical protein EB796_023199 [Bugula neritina]|uniref:Uncharacterized protein n=1 Tax=Bugula neritina TaxID=10212 RepID=A0A7J7IXE1_BUGNE|nr:hypothetical protein EB796_023199 [Bugula neritina]